VFDAITPDTCRGVIVYAAPAAGVAGDHGVFNTSTVGVFENTTA
jgi:hypothetical protein